MAFGEQQPLARFRFLNFTRIFLVVTPDPSPQGKEFLIGYLGTVQNITVR